MLKYIFLTLLLSILSFAKEPIVPIPKTVSFDKQKALLGKKLFYDTRLSEDSTICCNSCHNLSDGGADPATVSYGVKGHKGNIQSPTVYNARYNFKQFWNGRANDLKEQAAGPLNNPNEHGMNPKLIEQRLNNSKTYKKLFKAVYKTKHISYSQVLDAIVEFEKALITPNAKFDKYLRKEAKLTPQEQEGYALFKQYGCITCHNGINVGGNSFQKMGTFFPYDTNASYPDRAEVLHNKNYRNVYKVPTLRNIALTAPYFHDGSATTLLQAVQKMSYHNLGIEIPKEDAQKIVAFLKTLTGEMPKIAEQE